MAEGYFNDGTIDIELGAHVFATPSVYRRSIVLTPHDDTAQVMDSGGGVQEVTVTGQRVRANLGDAERYIYEHFHALATSDPGTLGFEDNLGQRVTFGDAVCIGAVGEVRAFRFADMQMDFLSPEKSGEPVPLAQPSAPGTYAGTDTLQDYAVYPDGGGVGGVTIGTQPVGMRIEMTRDYPLREIPRARGARSRGPRRGAAIRFIVTAHAVVPPQNLARYLQNLVRQIGPRPVDLTGNGNTYEDVLLESVRPTHTDLRHTSFEAEFVMQLGPYTPVAPPGASTTEGAPEPPPTTGAPGPTTTSTEGPTTTSVAPPSTTTGPSITTTEGPTTTTQTPSTTTECGVDCNECEPPLRCDYCVTLTGLGGDFAAYNGEHVVPWLTGCLWLKYFGAPGSHPFLQLVWGVMTNRWEISLALADTCVMGIGGQDNQPCDPTGFYVLYGCNDSGCFDGNSCEESAGAQAWVCGVCPCLTSTPGPTTTGAPTTTTTVAPPSTSSGQAVTTTTAAPASTSSGQAATTTAAGPECPEDDYCEESCAYYYYCADFDGVNCGGAPTCASTIRWDQADPYGPCAWHLAQSAGCCVCTSITCVDGKWAFTMTHAVTGWDCDYEKSATAASCPAGTYSKVSGTCSDCPSEVTVYS